MPRALRVTRPFGETVHRLSTFPARSGTSAAPLSIVPTTIEGLPGESASAGATSAASNCHSYGSAVNGSVDVSNGGEGAATLGAAATSAAAAAIAAVARRAGVIEQRQPSMVVLLRGVMPAAPLAG